MALNKLFVGNLSFKATEDELHEVFAQYGELDEVKIILDRESGRSRGFAFVTFADENCAKEALILDGVQIHERSLRVSIATERPRNQHPDQRASRYLKGSVTN